MPSLDAYLTAHQANVKDFVTTIVNKVFTERPADPIASLVHYANQLAQKGSEGAVKEEPGATGGNAAPKPSGAILKLRKQAKAALAKVRSLEAEATHATLPEALRNFVPLTAEAEVKAVVEGLHELELAVAREPSSEAAVTKLRLQHGKIIAALRDKIATRTAEGVLTELVPLCEAAIRAGNRDFQVIYNGVWKVIQSGEASNLERYRATIAALRAWRRDDAKQRDEAADAATLLADAARAKPSFDEIIRAVREVSGAKLELAVLGDAGRKHGPKATGLKKTLRCIEKALLRPDEGRGRTERVCDVVRGMLIAKDMATVAMISNAFVALAEAGLVTIVRIKDRFEDPSAGGWRDLMINLVIEASGGERHVCEVQVVHEMMLTARKGLPGHEIYAIVRSASELIESCGQERALRLEAVRAMRQAGATPAEIVAEGEDAWLLEDAAWVEAAGSREALVKGVVGDLDEEGRITTIDLSIDGNEENERLMALPDSVCALRGLTDLKLKFCSSLTTVQLRTASLTSIGDHAFYFCRSLITIELPTSLTSICDSAFARCYSLSTIELPATLMSIGNYAFSDCSSLNTIELPATLTSIGDSAFRGCSSLSENAMTAIHAVNPEAFYDKPLSPFRMVDSSCFAPAIPSIASLSHATVF